jgi:hypothetical protein
MLHRLNDGSQVRLIQAKALVQIPIWNGNRTMSGEHVEKIKGSITDIRNLDFGFRLVSRMDEDADGKPMRQTVVVDGQHRRQVLSDYFTEHPDTPDFPIVIVEKEIQEESDIITYFNTLNTQKPIPWKSDRPLIANKYILALEKEFNTGKGKGLIRSGSTKRPYLSVEKLREELCKKDISESPQDVAAFIARVKAYNMEFASDYATHLTYKKPELDMIEKGKELKFMLAFDTKLAWVTLCLGI